MIEMETLRNKLEQIIGTPLERKELNQKQSESMFLSMNKKTKDQLLKPSVASGDAIQFPLYVSNGHVHVLEAEATKLSTEVIGLVELVISQARHQIAGVPSALQGKEERELLRLSIWIQQQMEQGEGDLEVPDEFELKRKLMDEMVPFLLVYESIHMAEVTVDPLKKLLRSYFNGEVIIVPLRENEWLILARRSLVAGGADDKEEENAESETDMLSAFCSGLYELIASEWVGTFHLSVAPSFSPVKGLPSMVSMLRETIFLGRTFHISEHVHFPWELLLERLVHSIPVDQRRRFLEQAGDHGVLFTDNETLSTLETFFQLDCNVSETAKRLYIHRNTLLYRLDKIKQETGLDVRSFGDAVLVKLTMLLYKVTKRK